MPTLKQAQQNPKAILVKIESSRFKISEPLQVSGRGRET